MSLARVFCSWSIAAVLLLLSIACSNSTASEKSADPVVDENGNEVNKTSNVTLTGNPQIDYVHDPNLPRELNGYNLSDYPFFSRVPAKINFSCEGLKDGFYASIEHKCQIYHHCLFNTRADFLCANYTAFDQRTFICQFVSEVDCPNSHMFFHRNEALYPIKSSTTAAPLNIDRGLYARRPPKRKNPSRLRPIADDESDPGTDLQQSSTAAPAPSSAGETASKPSRDTDYEDDYDEDDDYAVRRPARPSRRRRPGRKCRNGRRRGRRCRPRRPVYDYRDDDYVYDDDYDYAYYDDMDDRPRKKKPRRPVNTIPAGTSQSSSSETPPPTTKITTTTTTTTTELPPLTSSESTGPLDAESITVLQKQRDEIFTKTRKPFVRQPSLRPFRTSEKTTVTSSTTTSTTTERAKPPTTTTATTSTTTDVPQYMYEYEYYEDETPMDVLSTTTTTTIKPFLRGKLRGGNSAAASLEKQRVQQSIQVRVTEDSGTSTNTIRRRDNSNVQTPTRVATLPTTPSTTTTSTLATPAPSRPARFWQRMKPSVKSVSTKTTSTTTTTTSAPYYQEYQDYEDVADQPPSAQPPTAPEQSSKFQPLLNPQHQYGTSPAVSDGQRQTYANSAPSPTPSRGHGSSSSLSSSSYARPNKPYSMQQYSQNSGSSSSPSINSNNNNNNNNNNANYNSNSYHRQRSPPAAVPKPEFISLVDEDYNNPYVSPVAVAPTSSTSTRLHSGGGGQPGYHQHPVRFFEQQHHSPFLFGAASEYNSPQFAFPPRNYPGPSNFQPYGHSNRRFSANIFSK